MINLVIWAKIYICIHEGAYKNRLNKSSLMISCFFCKIELDVAITNETVRGIWL